MGYAGERREWATDPQDETLDEVGSQLKEAAGPAGGGQAAMAPVAANPQAVSLVPVHPQGGDPAAARALSAPKDPCISGPHGVEGGPSACFRRRL